MIPAATTNTRVGQARTALQEALRTRSEIGAKPWEAVCVYDAADQLDMEVRFVDLPSAEAIYINASPARIFVSAHRPSGRRAFNCAHELGHHRFGHGSRIDELLDDDRPTARHDPDEVLANLFAGFFLMPKTAVLRGFKDCSVMPKDCTPEHVAAIAGWLGVGYTSLIYHMALSLRIISQSQADALLRISPRRARGLLLGEEVDGDVYIVRRTWEGRPVDLSVKDYAVLPPGTIAEGSNVELASAPAGSGDASSIFQACKPGLGRFIFPDSGGAVYVRVAKRDYTGLAKYRHLAEVDDDETA